MGRSSWPTLDTRACSPSHRKARPPNLSANTSKSPSLDRPRSRLTASAIFISVTPAPSARPDSTRQRARSSSFRPRGSCCCPLRSKASPTRPPSRSRPRSPPNRLTAPVQERLSKRCSRYTPPHICTLLRWPRTESFASRAGPSTCSSAPCSTSLRAAPDRARLRARRTAASLSPTLSTRCLQTLGLRTLGAARAQGEPMPPPPPPLLALFPAARATDSAAASRGSRQRVS
mmetsp:Transcript_8892/g.27938  ORF Transcript_8892/g.27938 Transcript_8892/m.27938 type:complete len:231 (+) Transcript_8892:242-934(+)